MIWIATVLILFGIYFIIMGSPIVDRLPIGERPVLSRWAYVLGGIGFVISGIGDVRGYNAPLHRLSLVGACFVIAAFVLLVLNFLKRR
jgi:hypothetical protein